MSSPTPLIQYYSYLYILYNNNLNKQHNSLFFGTDIEYSIILINIYIFQFYLVLFDGNGTEYFVGGDKYIGKYKEGNRHGHGTYY